MSEIDDPDVAMLEALEPRASDLLTLEEVSRHSGISETVVEVLSREGWIPVHETPDGARFDRDDLGGLEAGMRLVEAGVPLAELLDLARRMDEAMGPLAESAVDVFARFVRDSVEAASGSTSETAERLTRVVDEMLPATAELVGRHFTRLVVKHATARLSD